MSDHSYHVCKVLRFTCGLCAGQWMIEDGDASEPLRCPHCGHRAKSAPIIVRRSQEAQEEKSD